MVPALFVANLTLAIVIATGEDGINRERGWAHEAEEAGVEEAPDDSESPPRIAGVAGMPVERSTEPADGESRQKKKYRRTGLPFVQLTAPAERGRLWSMSRLAGLTFASPTAPDKSWKLWARTRLTEPSIEHPTTPNERERLLRKQRLAGMPFASLTAPVVSLRRKTSRLAELPFERPTAPIDRERLLRKQRLAGLPLEHPTAPA